MRLNNKNDLVKKKHLSWHLLLRMCSPPFAPHATSAVSVHSSTSPWFEKDWPTLFLLCLVHQFAERCFSLFFERLLAVDSCGPHLLRHLQGVQCLTFQPRDFSWPSYFKGCNRILSLVTISVLRDPPPSHSSRILCSLPFLPQ